MPKNEKVIYVYDSFTFDEPKLLGRLFVNTIKGGETYSFEYDNEWLSSTNYPVSIDPDFMGYGGTHMGGYSLQIRRGCHQDG